MLKLTFLQISVCAGMSATALAQSAHDARIERRPGHDFLFGNVEAVNADARTDAGARVIRLRKELCKGEMPAAEIFYKKPENPKTK